MKYELTYELLKDLVDEEVRRLTADEFEMRVRAEVLGILKACGLDDLMKFATGTARAN